MLFRSQAGDHDHGDVPQFGVGLHGLEDFVASEVRHQDIQQHEVKGVLADHFQRAATVLIDAVPPTPVDVQTVGAGTLGRADAGDRIVFTFSEALDPTSILGGWSGKGTLSAVVRITDGGTGNDVLTVWNSSNTVQTGLGSIDLGRSDYVSGNATFGAGGAVSSIGLAGAVVTVTQIGRAHV